MREFTWFMQNLAGHYPEAEKIVVVLDNLNTHSPTSFYSALEAESAQKLAAKFEFVHTLLSASWSNMIEIEFSALSRLCLNRRLPSINQLSKQVFQFFKEWSDDQIKINWQFSCQNTQKKLNRHYSKVNEKNIKYSEN